MAIQFDLIIPPVIVGFIILAMFSINSAMMESSVDNRLSHEMQSFADNSVTLIQHELRTLDSFCPNFTFSDTTSTICFINTKEETIEISRKGKNLVIDCTPTSSTCTEEEYPARLDSLEFKSKSKYADSHILLKIRAFTKSTPDQQVGGEEGQTVQAYAEKQVFLRNFFHNIEQ